MRSRCDSTGPRFDEIELHIPADAVKVPLIVGHKHATCLATRQRKEHIVRERLREAADLDAVLASHVG